MTTETGTSWYVVKAQIHAGGRGKGGGVKLAKSLADVETISNDIIGMMLKTPQTPPEGKKVNQVLIAEDVYYPGDEEPDEYYMSVLLNRATGKNMIMYSTEGGMDIETVAEETPHLIFTEEIDPLLGLMPFQARKVAFNLGLSGTAFKEMTKFVSALYKAYVESDSSMFEINPVLKTSDDLIMAVDAKVSIDDIIIGDILELPVKIDLVSEHKVVLINILHHIRSFQSCPKDQTFRNWQLVGIL